MRALVSPCWLFYWIPMDFPLGIEKEGYERKENNSLQYQNTNVD